ncbi:helix-turn-helix domain-containing protein [Streptomyces sp. B6B3]|uniref:helix-turn-helix domain-containing protein n=1 Tax=Streptomyces sp. B6B3 TaxID=3153570 RepID=UPI00325C85D8
MATDPHLPTTRFGLLLREARRMSGLTQRELAVASGISVRSVSELESGRNRGPHRSTVEALADSLGASPPFREVLRHAAAAGRAGRRRDPTTDAPAALPEPAQPAFPAPPGNFTGRGLELARLGPLVAAAAEGRTGTAVITTVAGQPGIGKTALALHVAHECAGSFPDGLFHVDLAGAGTRPMPPAEALSTLLLAMGLPAERIPLDAEERGDLYRSLANGRRMLLLLDNAAGECQVRPLLPGGPHCLVLVTSRRSLAGLESAARFRLDVLSREEAVRLLDRTAGGAAVAAEPEAAEQLVRLCGRLPLALRIAGSRLAGSVGRLDPAPARRLAGLLRHKEHRLDCLGYGDQHVRTAFEMSYRQLPPEIRGLFRLLTLVPGPDFGAEVAASLTALAPADAEAALDELADAGMVEPAPAAFRYRYHDLVRLFAAEALEREDAPAVRAAAVSRMTETLLARAVAAARAAGGGRGEASPEALDWLDTEFPNWSAATRRAAALGRHREVAQVAEAMYPVFDDLRHHAWWWRELLALGARAVRELGRNTPRAPAGEGPARCPRAARHART